MSRLEGTFQIEAALTTKRVQKWIVEAIASGAETPADEEGNGRDPQPGVKVIV